VRGSLRGAGAVLEKLICGSSKAATAPLIFTENGSSYKLFGRASGGAAGARDLVGFSREAGAE
jgi:hypothetical protein